MIVAAVIASTVICCIEGGANQHHQRLYSVDPQLQQPPLYVHTLDGGRPQ